MCVMDPLHWSSKRHYDPRRNESVVSLLVTVNVPMQLDVPLFMIPAVVPSVLGSSRVTVENPTVVYLTRLTIISCLIVFIFNEAIVLVPTVSILMSESVQMHLSVRHLPQRDTVPRL